ncbi:MAG: methyl-accepting chemotaxis protein [Bacillota bacterium]
MKKVLTFKSIKMKLFVAFSVIIILVLLLGITNFIGMKQSNANTKEIIKEEMQLLVADEQLAINMAERTSQIRGYLLYGENKYKQNFKDTVEETIKLENFVLDHADSKQVKSLMDKKIEWGHLTDKVFKEYDSGDKEKAMLIMTSQVQPLANDLISGFKDLAADKERTINSMGESMIETGNSLLIIGIVVTAVVIILGALIALITSNSITRPLQLVKQRMNIIAEGKLNHEPLVVKTKDEIGQLTNAANTMNANLKELLSKVKQVSSKVNDQSEALTQAANEVQQGTEQVAVTMQELASGSEGQASHAGNLASMMHDFDRSIQEVNTSSEMIQNASIEILDQTEAGQVTMVSTKDQVRKVDQIVKDAVQRVEGLDTKSQQISNLVTVISDIAEQTNLLALNAAIEAARAGEHGQGFSVVADEVRKLAEQVSSSLDEITNAVGDIQSESQFVVTTLQTSYREVEEGTGQMESTEETFNTIYTSVKHMTEQIRTVKNHLVGIAESSKEMNGSVSEIAAISQESAAGVEQTSASTQQTSSSMEEVAANADQLADLADELNMLIKRFNL